MTHSTTSTGELPPDDVLAVPGAAPDDGVVIVEATEAGEAGSTTGTTRSRATIFWREWLKPFLFILVVLLSFRSAVADWNHVPTGSMRPNILEGDRIFVNKVAYDLRVPFTTKRIAQWSSPSRDDIVVFLSPADGKRLVKRVVGLPGDRIELRRHRLWVNGRQAAYQRVDPDLVNYLDESERASARIDNESIAGGDPHPVMTRRWFSGRSTFSPITLGENEYFVMGDNRDDSADSRVFGVVDRRLVLGEATAVAVSVDPEKRYRPRWDRFFLGL